MCGCGGSTNKAVTQPRERDAQKPREAKIVRAREGGPGHPDYYFTGPTRTKSKA